MYILVRFWFVFEVFRGCFDVFLWWPSHWKWPKEDSRFAFSGYKIFATRPSKDLVRLPNSFFLGICEDLLQISK